MDRTSLFPFYGFSPAIRSLRLLHVTPNALDLIYPFPLLEDLTLIAPSPMEDEDGWNVPLTSPRLTGTLSLLMFERASSATCRLLDLPGGLHFSEITVLFPISDRLSVGVF